jgi:hypothetical protein
MEYWNNGKKDKAKSNDKKECFCFPNIPVFRHSIIPTELLFSVRSVPVVKIISLS